MRAINLVPAESRPGRVTGGKSGGAVYGVLGGLAVLLLAFSVLALAKRDQARADQDLAAIEQSTQAYQSLATKYASFEQAADAAAARITTVRSLAEARFDWAGSMRELARLVPETTRVSSLSASVRADTAAGGGANSTLRGSVAQPAIAMLACTLTQDSAAELVTQLQAMRRVTNVTLESSTKASSTGGSGDGCEYYTAQIVVFFASGNSKPSAEAVPSAGGTETVSTESAGATTPPATTPGG